jgi:hypothetical protein
MKHQDFNPEERLNQALAELRATRADDVAISAAGERVWERISQHSNAAAGVESIRGCEDVIALLPTYSAGRLPAARVLLVEAHLQECGKCRQQAQRGKHAVTPQPWQHELPRGASMAFRWVVAAAAVVLLAVTGYFIQDRLSRGPAGMRASVLSISGSLYRIGSAGEQPLQAGDEIGEGEDVRSAAGSRAMLRLRDGSVIEMNERAELGVSLGRSDTTIKLDRGNIIVQAAKRRTGHLYVAAPDCRISVTGTVFSVNSGMKGSRVSVIEGEVRVANSGVTSVLHPGDQLSTNTAVAAVPVKQEIAWSQNFDKHLALLAEFAKLENKLQTVQMPGLRYQSKLLPLLPSPTVVYASIPNLGDAVQQANRLFQQQLQQSPILNDWWQQAQKGGADFAEVIDEIHSLSQYIGDEIVFSVAMDGREAEPLVIAQVQSPGLKQFLEQEYAKRSNGSKNEAVRILDEAELQSAGTKPDGGGIVLLVRPDFVAAAVNVGTLRAFDLAIKQGGGGFAPTPFAQRIAGSYGQGAGLLFAANLQAMAARDATVNPHHNPQVFASTGLADVQYLVVERKDNGGQAINRADLTFSGTRRGFASWLAAPAPIGGLDFVSKDAGAAAAFLAKTPAQMFDDVLNIASLSDPKAESELAKAEAELKIRLRQDLAETLGGEATFALDGPILPTPSWKVVLEVYNPGRLQSTIQQFVSDANEHITDSNRKLTMEQQSADGLTYYTIRFPDAVRSAELDYTFVDGYMVLGPSRALVRNAVSIHQSGNSLSRSSDFHALLPQDQNTDVSALLYQNLAPVVGPVLQQLSPSQLQSLQQIAAETKPSVVCAYGEPNAIRVASTSRFFGLDLNTLTLSTLLKMAQPAGARPHRAPVNRN